MRVGSPKDPLKLEDTRIYTASPSFAVFYPIDKPVDGKTQVSAALVPGQDTAVIITIGQSNSANHCGNPRTATSPLAHNFDYTTGGMYRAADPMLGCSGPTMGSFNTYLADKLISSGAWARVIIASMAVNATRSVDWALGGPFNQNIRVMARRLAANGLIPTAITWQMGESDNAVATPSANVTWGIQSAIQTFRDEGVTCPAFVAVTSTWPGYDGSAIRAAQQASWDTSKGIYPGPDTDTLGATYRDGGGLHFNDAGNDAHAQLWTNIIRTHFGR